ncbi:MAG TPA: hypothetical protein VK742_02660 [Candidatus Sulfotelmatobacter sp.]|nr:hypothetical protein [Candidatus Sulfotelmatobacter sp.]
MRRAVRARIAGATNVVRSALATRFRRLYRRGQRSALSLPGELRTLAICKINKRPIFRTCDEFFPDRIFQNVIRFLFPAFIIPQAVFKKVALPKDAGLFRRPFLPFADDILDSFAGRRKRNQRMQMVRHQQKQMRPPQEFFLPMANRFKNACGNLRQGKLISASRLQARTPRGLFAVIKSFPAVDRYEIDFLLRVNPQWNVVRECFS